MANRRSIRGTCFHLALVFTLVVGWASRGDAATWTPLGALAPDFTGVAMLLPDGTVIVQGYSPGNNWMRLTPNSAGSYIGGTWSSIAPMSIPRLYFASHILRNLKVWVLGGEYSGAGLPANWTATGEMYDMVTNTWSPIASYPAQPGCPGGAAACFGDDPSMLLAGDKILAGDLLTNRPKVYDIATNTWSAAGVKVYADSSDEESWAKMADGSVLTYDLFRSVATGGAYAERYDPVTNSWSSLSPSDGTALGTIPQLSSRAMGFELGPILRLQDGRQFVIGTTGHTGLYDPSTNTWAAGPDILSATGALFGAADAPGAVMPSGHVLFASDASPQFTTPFHAPTKLFDFNPVTNTISEVSPAPPGGLATNLAGEPSYPTRMLVLPTGQVLVIDSSRQLWVYTPDGVPNPALRPSVTRVTYSGGGVFLLGGKQLNGQNAGSGYGDDAESDENFPIVRLRNSTGGVFYARTSNWSTTGVATGATPETVNFTLPPGLTTPGNYSVQVIGAGIAGFPVFVNITAAQIAGS